MKSVLIEKLQQAMNVHVADPDYPLRNAVSDILGIPRRVW